MRTRLSLVTLIPAVPLSSLMGGADTGLSNFFVKLISRYDYEFCYSNSMMDLTVHMTPKE